MKFPGFIGPAYTLDSVNVDAQRCVNMYPEKIESGFGKEGQLIYLKATPGLEKVLEVGSGPIRCIHEDSIGRILVVSGDRLYQLEKSDKWRMKATNHVPSNIEQSTDINTSTEVITLPAHGYYTGLKVQLSSSDTIPPGLSASTDYWIIVVDDDSFKLASSLADAISGSEVDISGVGTGTLTITLQGPSSLSDITADSSTSTFTKASHSLYTGVRVRVRTLSLDSGISFDTDYFVIVTDANTFMLASSIENAEAGTEVELDSISSDWVVTDWSEIEGTVLDTSSGVVKAASMSYLGEGTDSSTVFVDGTNNYLLQQFDADDHYGVAFGDYTSFGFVGVPTATDIAWIDGFFIVDEGGTNRFYTSFVQSFAIDALSFASSEGSPDVALSVIANNRNLFIFNETTTEIYSNTGNADFPFERVGGGFLEVGTLAKYSVAKAGGLVFWLGRSAKGQGAVYASSGTSFQRISTHAIEQAIKKYAAPDTAKAFGYEDNGHAFYVLNFDEATWVYDLSTGLWHERAYANAGSLERHRAGTHAYSAKLGLHIVGDYETNEIYLLKDDVYSDDGDEITRLRSSPHISAGGNRIVCHKFQLDMETGVGLDGGVQGSSPTVMLDMSKDGGHTWSSESYALADASGGQIGEYKTRVIWRRLGSFRDCIFRVKMTDPVKCVWIDAQIDVEAGAS